MLAMLAEQLFTPTIQFTVCAGQLAKIRGAVQLAVVPVPLPLQFQLYTLPVTTAVAVPALQRLTLGGVAEATPLALPHEPLMFATQAARVTPGINPLPTFVCQLVQRLAVAVRAQIFLSVLLMTRRQLPNAETSSVAPMGTSVLAEGRLLGGVVARTLWGRASNAPASTTAQQTNM